MKEVYEANPPACERTSVALSGIGTAKFALRLTLAAAFFCLSVLGVTPVFAANGGDDLTCDISYAGAPPPGMPTGSVILCLAANGQARINAQLMSIYTSSSNPACSRVRIWTDAAQTNELLPDDDIVDCDDLYINTNTPIAIWVTREIFAQGQDPCRSAALPFWIYVTDCTPPSLACPAPLTYTCAFEVAANLPPNPMTPAEYAAIGGNVTDNCTATVSYTDGAAFNEICANQYQFERTFTATDQSGNASTCTQLITVSDQVAPTFTTMPQNLEIPCGIYRFTPAAADVLVQAWLVGIGGATVSDNCGDLILPTVLFCFSNQVGCTYSSETFAAAIRANMPDACSPSPREVQVVFYVKDACGNENSASAKVILTDNVAPVSLGLPTLPGALQNYTCADQIPAPNVESIRSLITDFCTPQEDLLLEWVSDVPTTVDGCTAAPSLGNFFPADIIIRTYRATDCEGNSATFTQRIRVRDDEPPVWTNNPNSVSYNCENTDLDDVTNWLATNGVDGAATDNCNGVTITYSRTNGTPITPAELYAELTDWCPTSTSIRERTIRFTATDGCGNTAARTATIRLFDVQGPMAGNPADVTVSCSADITQSELDVTDEQDNCSDDVVVTILPSETLLSGNGCPDDPTIIRQRYQLTDCVGNTSIVSRLVTVQDETDPVWQTNPQNFSIACDAGGINGALDAWLASNGNGGSATDNCGSVTVTTVPNSRQNIRASLECVTGGFSTTVTFWASDNCGNSVSRTATVTLTDNTAPTASATPANYNCIEDVPAYNAAVVGNRQDNCADITEITVTPRPDLETDNDGDGCSDSPLIISRRYEISDCAGNTALVTQMITVVDNVSPNANCQPITVDLGADGTVTVNASQFDNGSDDNCDAPLQLTFSRDILLPDVNIVYDAPSESKEFTCADIRDIENCQANTNNSELIAIRLFATDACGNTQYCDTWITVRDVQAPVIPCPDDVTVNTSDRPEFDCKADVAITPPVPVENCSILCYEMKVEKEINGVFVVINPENGNTGDPNFRTQVSPDFNYLYTFEKGPHCEFEDPMNPDDQYRITFYVRDEHGNADECSYIITVKDDEAPEWNNCPQTIDAEVVTGDCYQVKCWDRPTPYDNCQFPTGPCPDPQVVVTTSDPTVMVNSIQNSQSDCAQFPVGTTYVYYTATDACGNVSTCTVTVNISDPEPPMAMCAGPVTVNMEPDGVMQLSIADIDAPGTQDNCAICFKGISRDPDCCFGPFVSLTCDDVNTTVRVYMRVEDCSAPVANSAMCYTDIFVQDMQSPGIASCPADITVGTDADVCNAVVTYPTPTFNDGCDSPHDGVFVSGLLSGATFPIGATLVRYSYTSASGYTVYCNFNVTVEDDQNPNIVCPANVTDLTCTTPTPAPYGIFDFAGTLTDNCGVTQLLNSEVDNGLSSCPNDGVRVITRTYTAFDAAGNSSSCTQSFTYLEDAMAPLFVVNGFQFGPNGFIDPTTGDCADDVPDAPTVSATDGNGCGGVTVDFEETITNLNGDGAPECANQFMVTRTWVASDICENQRTLVQVIIINDNINPVLNDRPADMDLQCASAVPAAPSIGATDNCGDVTVDFTETTDPGACPNSFVMTRTWLATDACGNTDVHTQTITVNDNTNPVLSEKPADDNVVCAEDVPVAPVVTATDNCGVVNVDFSETTIELGCENHYQIIRRWVATDLCGNQDKHTQTITVNDNVAPTWDQPEGETVVIGDCADDVPAVPVYTATDNCANPADVDFNEVIYPGLCPNSFSIIRTWTAIDECGNGTTRVQTITIEDNEPPHLAVRPLDLNLSCIDDVPTPPYQLATDNCEIVFVDFSESVEPGDCINDVIIYRRWVATDLCGNETTWEQTITVKDTEAPKLAVRPLDLNQLKCMDDVPLAPYQSATDNCGIAFVDFSEYMEMGDCINDVLIVRRWVAYDACGNTSDWEQEIRVRDDVPPALTVTPFNLTFECSEDVPPVPVQTATDNCGIVFLDFSEELQPGGCENSFTLVRRWVATDACGNVSSREQYITVDDNQAPQLQVTPLDVTVACSELVPDVPAQSVIDNCDAPVDVDFSEVIQPGGCENYYNVVRTWIATDACGNTDKHVWTIRVHDTVKPTLHNLPMATVNVECSEQVPAVAAVTASDNCLSPVDLDFTEVEVPGTCPNQYSVVRTWTAEDACGNSTFFVQTINVNDIKAPTWTSALPGNMTLQCGEQVPAPAVLTATDNCAAPVDIEYNETYLQGNGPNDMNQIIRVWTAEDDCGNATTHMQVINVNDTVDPVLVGTPDALVGVECSEDVPAVAVVTATDNCQGTVDVDFNEVIVPGTCPNQYSVVRTWTAVDFAGNSSIFVQTIVVSDTKAPTWTSALPGDLTLECGETVPAAATLTATDNCAAPVDIELSETYLPGAGPNDGNVLVRTWTAEDDCGNATTHVQTITINDVTDPVLANLPPATVNVECSEQVPAVAAVTASDNCQGTLDVDFFEVEVPGTCPNQYSVVRTWTAVDFAGNSTIFVQTINVNDTKAPTWTSALPGDLTLQCGETVPAAATLTATDNCAAPVDIELSETYLPGAGPNDNNVIVRTWTAEDDCGNATTHVQTITVLDTEAPVLGNLPPATVNVECAEDVPAVAAVTASDNCQGTLDVDFFEVEVPGTCHDQYTVVRTWTAVDFAGNSTIFVQTINVFDDKAPVWNGPLPGNLALDCGEAIPAAAILTAFDNCDSPVYFDFSETWQPGAGPNDGNILVRTWTATDNCGNATTHVQTVTVNDVIAPVLANLPMTPVNVECSEQVPALAAVTASDNCQGTLDVDFYEVEVPGTCPNQYTVLRVWTATDFAGNSAVFTQTINVNDTSAPTWTSTLPTDLSLNCGEQVPAAATLTATDNCVSPVFIEFNETYQPGAGPNDGSVIVRTWTATDDCGNATSHVQTITINDTEAPVLTGLPAAVVDIECADDVPVIAIVSASDNCQGTIDVDFSEVLQPGDCANRFTLVRTWTAVDFAGNAAVFTQTVNVNDNVAPAMSCPAPQTAQCNVDEIAIYANLNEFTLAGGTASDNCGLVVNDFGMISQTSVGNVFTRVYAVSDACGNVGTCAQTITILDTQAPVFLNCPTGPLVFGNDPDKCSAKINWSIPVAVDNCVIPTVEQISGPAVGSIVAVGNYTITYRATDAAGNVAFCTFAVQVMDTQAPEFDADITMPNDTTVQCNAVPTNCVYHGPLVCTPLTNADVNDNCTPASQLVITFTEVSTQCGNQAQCCFYTYTLTRTWTVTDAAGNSRQHTQVINVVDTQAPTAVCKNITVTLDKFGVATITGKDLDGGSTDNCAANQFLTFTASKTSFGCADLGANTVTLTVTDPCGNSSTCTAIVTVVEGEGACTPEFDVVTTCKDNATTLDNGQFIDLITVKALAGQTWTLTGNSGLFNVNSPNPPVAPTALPVGTTFTMGSADGIDNDGDGQTDEADEMVYYTLRGIHVDGLGYNIGLSNNIGQSATISNKAYYPTPIFLNLDGPFCLSTPPFTIQVGEQFGAAGVVTSITVNGVATNTFNAAQLGIGFHTVEATFDAGDATTNLVINGVLVGGTNDEALADPGCEQKISKIVQIVGTPTTVACNDVINVSLDADCEEVILPDMVLEGSYFCYDDYTVIITYPFGTNSYNPPNKVDATHIGKTINFTLRHIISGNLCWGTIVVEDKLAPEITCPADVQILCTQSEDNLSLTGQPTVVDCSAFSLVREDQYQQFSCAENNEVFTRVTRLWVATDAWGNKDSCTQIIDILRGTVDQVAFPADVEYECTNVPASLQPGTTGWPKIAGINLTTNGTGACGLSVSFTDELATICPGSYKIIRTWKINDWCSAGTGGPSNIEHIQYIKVTDAPPTVDFSNFTYDADNDWYVINTNAIVNGQCVSAGPIPTAIFNGVCNEVVDVKVTTPLGPITNGGLLPQPGLGLGLHNITYVLTDECGNITSITIKVNVVDNVPPSVSCDEFTQVALGGNGQIEVFATTFDDGTYDNCCLDGFLVRRMVDGPCDNDDVEDTFADRVLFCCEDINDTITVVFRAFDCYGNENDCMVRVLVEDKIKPVCQSPANVTVSCENFDPSLWAYGAATAVDNCCIDTITTTVNFNLFDTLCNKGTITRTFRAFDCAGQSSQCTQRIVVQYEQDYFVRFPNDVIVTQCNGSGNYGQPTFFGEDCELLAVSFTDEVFTVVPDACYKIERTWHVINWCTFNPNAPLITVPNPNPNSIANHPSNLPGPIVSPVQTPGDPWKSTIIAILPGQAPTNYATFWDANANGYSYKQIIKIIDNEAPIFADCPASPVTINDLSPNDPLFWNEMYYWDNSNQSHDLCEGTTDLSVTLTDSCGGDDVSVKYILFLDLDNDGSMETVVSSTNIPPANTVFFGNAFNPNFTGGTAYNFDNRPVPLNQKYRFNIDIVRSGNNATAKLIWDTPQQQANLNDNVMQGVSPQLPYGTHKIKWIATDGCGNESVCEYTIIVKDGKAPTVVCLNGLSVNIMPTGMITLWGSDFLQYTEDNCTPAGLIELSIVESDESTGVFPVDFQGNPISNVTFDCNELGTQTVQLWGRDVAGNADYCETYVIVQDPNGFCGMDPISVAGDLKTETQNGLEEASVELLGTHPALPPVSMFDQTGDTGEYLFSNALPLAANYTVTPLKDDNHLNGVTTYDLVLISKHILGLEPLGSPYKMIAADANKSNSITTFDIVELRKLILGIYSELPNNTSWRFVDKTYSFADPNNPFAAQFPEFKSVADVQASQMDDDFVALKVGDVNGSAIANSLMSADDRTNGTLLFDVEDRTVKAGEEFTVNFTAADQVIGYQFTMNLKGLEVLDIVPGNGMKLDNFGIFSDAITTSFDGKEKGTFTVKFRATTSGQLSNMIGVSSRITKAEAYHNDARMDVAFRFNGSTIAGVGFELYQNTPNPFINKTMIGFHLPEATEATLTIFDESGRMIFTQTGDFGKGYNAITIDRNAVSTTGVLYYKLETATDSASKKMIQTK